MSAENSTCWCGCDPCSGQGTEEHHEKGLAWINENLYPNRQNTWQKPAAIAFMEKFWEFNDRLQNPYRVVEPPELRRKSTVRMSCVCTALWFGEECGKKRLFWSNAPIDVPCRRCVSLYNQLSRLEKAGQDEGREFHPICKPFKKKTVLWCRYECDRGDCGCRWESPTTYILNCNRRCPACEGWNPRKSLHS